jgi:two-component system, cell cycle sensor histidine kinase and response regulator CckA
MSLLALLSRLLRGRERPAYLRYGIAVLSVGLSLFAGLWLRPFTYRMPYLLFSAAILISLLYGGRRAAIVCAILSAGIAKYFFFPPYRSFSLDVTSIAGLIYFCLFFWIICWLIDIRWGRVEKARRESDERFQLFIEHAPAALAMFDREMRYLCVSRRWRADYRLGDRDLKGVSHYEIFPEIPARWKDAHCRALAGEVLCEENDRFERADGSVQWIRWEIRPWCDGKGAIGGIVIFADDVSERKREEERLRLSEDRYRDLVENSQDLICTHDLSGKLLSVNLAPAKLLGYSVAELLTIPMREIVAPEFRGHFDQYLERMNKHGADKGILTVQTRTGERRIWEYENTLRIEGVDSPVVRGMARDVTEKVRAEAALKESERQFRVLGDAIPQLTWIANPDGWIHWYNQRWYQYTGSTINEMKGWGWQSVLDPGELPRVLERWQASITTGEPFEMVFSLRGADGVFRPFLTRIVAIKNAEGRVMQWFGTNTDISEQKRIERELRESEENFRTLVNCVPQMVWISTSDGLNTYCNRRWVEYTGMTLEESSGTGWRKPYHNDDKQVASDAWSHAVATGGRYQVESRLRAADGGYRWFLVQVEPVRDAGGKIVQWFGTCTDVEELKRAEEAVRDSEQRVAGIIGAAMDAIITVDEEERIVLFNAAAEKMFRCSKVEALGQKVERFIPLRFRVGHSNHIRKFGEDGVTTRVMGTLDTLWAVRADGDEFPMEASISKIDSRGRKLFTVIMRDITVRAQAEEKLREYARVVEGLEEMIVVVDREYRYLIANRAFLKFRGMSAKEVIGHTVEEVIGKDSFETRVKGKMDESFQGKVVQYEMVYDFPNVGNRELSVSYFPIEGRTGVDRIACILQDITLRKLAEEALRKSEDRFSKAFRNNPLAITLSTESEGRYLDVNDAFLDMLGYMRQDVIGQTVEDLHFWGHPSDREDMLKELKEKERVAKHHTQFRTAKGELREAEVWAESIELDGQRCVLGITHDTTDMQRLEGQFRQAQKMEAVGRLAGGIAHDFNNILGIIVGYIDISLDKIPTDSPASRYISEIKKAAQRAVLLTRQLLAFSRKQVVFPKILDLNDVVRNATKMVLRLVGEDIAVEFRPTVPLGLINADAGQIEQILMNLVVNARDAMPTGGRIIIDTGHAELDEHCVAQQPGARAGQHVVLVVSDTGCGMDEITKSQIFEPFFTTKEVGQGTGLGLSTVYGIVKQGGGYISVSSEPGEGTTFKIYFPLVCEKRTQPTPPVEAAEAPLGSETVLVVEDEKNLREVAVTLLQQGGYRVLEAKDAEEALRIIRTSQLEISLLLTDVIMPGRSGAELAREAQEGHPKMRCLFMSGYTGDLVSRQGVVMEETSFIEKPFTKRSLLMKVYSILHDGGLRTTEITN